MSIGRLLTSLPNFLSSESPKGLRRKMLENNGRLGMFVSYFDIQFVDGLWYAWYYFDAIDDEQIKSRTPIKV